MREATPPSRRRVLTTLGTAVLGAGGLAACTRGGRAGRSTTPPPTASARQEPTSPLILGSIGSAFGAPGQFEKQISLAIEEAVRHVNILGGGLFGQEVVLVDRVVVQEPGADVAAAVASLAEAGVSIVISSLEDAQLKEALPAFVEHGMLVICPWSSSNAVREDDSAGGMLIRLAPNDTAIAIQHVEAAVADAPEGTVPGTIAYVSPDTLQGRSLLAEIRHRLDPRGGSMVVEHFYPQGSTPDAEAIAAQVAAAPPALLVLNGGPESGPIASAVHRASEDEDGRSRVTIRTRMGPGGSVDYREAGLPAESLADAEGTEPGGPVDVGRFEDIMLNLDTSLLETGYAYGQQAFDAVVLACLGARHALAIDGASIAPSIPLLLVGAAECDSFAACDQLLRDAQALRERGDVAYRGMSGPLELGADQDVRAGQQRRITWSDAGERIVEPEGPGFEIEG